MWKSREVAALLSLGAFATVGVGAMAAEQRYSPVPGGFAIRNGSAEFSRPLYGWHGDDNEEKSVKSMPFAGDRPKVSLMLFNGPRIGSKPSGVLSFGDGTEDVESRYVWGRAEYDLAGKGTVKMARSASSDGLLVETTGGLRPSFDGDWILAAESERDGRTYFDFERKGMPERGASDVAAMFDAATNRLETLARTIEIKTPDPLIDSLLPCQLVAADAMFEGRIICHGVTNWRMPFAGWRGPYACLATGWGERFKENARLFFNAQKKDGRIPCKPAMDGSYNMNEIFCDAVLRYWLWSDDDAFMRECAYEGVKRHLAWMESAMKVPGEDLFENWLNAWNTDDKWCNGGAGTIASSYVVFAYRTMAEAAAKFGKTDDAKRFAERAAAVEKAVQMRLWDDEEGVWGEYRERFGLGRLVPCPDLSTVYTAIDSLAPDAVRNRRAVRWVEENVPTHFTKDGASLLYSSNRLPMFYSSCGRYQNEVFHWALACYQAGEPEIGWRNLHAAAEISARGETCGPGATFYDLDFNLKNKKGLDFSDSVGTFLRTVVEGVFGIRNGKAGEPCFPASWDFAEIKAPGVAFRWQRTESAAKCGDLPQPHRRWGKTKGEGADCAVPDGAKAEFVDLGGAFNQNLRLLHSRKYTPRIANFRWTGVPRTIMANGRSSWERHEVVGNRKWKKDWCIPKKLDWPKGGTLAAKYGPEFRLGAAEGENAAFVSFYDQFPKEVAVPLSGKARKLALLTAVSTNPNVAWMEAARVVVEYEDGTSATLSLVPPDNCDDWLSYSHGQYWYFDPKRDCRPYAVNGRPAMLGKTAHANVHAVALDPAKALKALRFECRGTETLAGLLGATLYR